MNYLMDVSIHAPARGATRKAIEQKKEAEGFNPRPRTGGDCHASESGKIRGTVSIHAPARGATNGERWNDDIFNVSIHAPARGAT